MKKGFTLLELLAVVVVLAVIAVIVTPFVANAIKSAKKGAFTNSAYGMITSAETYYGQKIVQDDMSETLITIADFGVNEPRFKYKGGSIESAYIEIDEKGRTKMFMWHDGFCATKNFGDAEVTVTQKPKEECNLEGPVPPSFNVDNTCVANSKTINFASLDPTVKYYYYLSTSSSDLTGGSWLELEENSVVVTAEGTHYLYVRGIKDNVVGRMAEPITVCIDNTEYEVAIVPTANGNVTPDKWQAQIGEEINFSLSPNTGYRISTLMLTNNNTNITSASKTNMLQGGITIDPSWSKISYAINKESGSGGQITSNRNYATYQDEVTITATPNTNYRLLTLTVDGADIKNTKKFNMPNRSVTVSATWELAIVTKYKSRTKATYSCTNKLNNGGFENNDTGWTRQSYAPSVRSGYYGHGVPMWRTGTLATAYDRTGNSGSETYMMEYQNVGLTVGHKYYGRYYVIPWVSQNSNLSSSWINGNILGTRFGGTGLNTVWTQKSNYITAKTTSAIFGIGKLSEATSPMYAWDDCVVIDLTACFGSGNEPEKTWLDTNFTAGITGKGYEVFAIDKYTNWTTWQTTPCSGASDVCITSTCTASSPSGECIAP